MTKEGQPHYEPVTKNDVSIRELQAIENYFSTYIGDVERDQPSILARLLVEVAELEEAINSGAERHEIAGEYVDVILFAIKGLTELGYMLDDVLMRKLGRNFWKYRKVKKYRESGMDWESAVKRASDEWNKGLDNEFLGRE